MTEIKRPKNFSFLEAIGSIDGRFRGRVESTSKYFSELAMMRGRVFVETEYLIDLLKVIGQPLNRSQTKKVRKIVENFGLTEAKEVWGIDEKINHDTKAIEYFLRGKFDQFGLSQYKRFIHLGLTSTDVDNTALALALKSFKEEVVSPQLKSLTQTLFSLANKQSDLVMLARTHGQVAVPTTAGKEMANFAVRLKTQQEKLTGIKIGAKLTGAVGNHNALVAAYPEINWLTFSKKFLNRLGLESYSMTTQVEPYEEKVELFQAIKRVNLVLLSLTQDLWGYLAIGYLSLKDNEGHVGSSTMPQKINPIGFELAEAYLTLSNSLFETLTGKLPLNRWQRDLTDKYLLRELGQALAMATLSYESIATSLKQVGFNKGVVDQDLERHWEIVSEGIQVILRSAGYEEAYEELKSLTRGREVTKKVILEFINKLRVSEEVKNKLRSLSPQTYTGYAKLLAKKYGGGKKK